MWLTPDFRLESEEERSRRAWERDQGNAYFGGVCDDVRCDFGCVDNAVLIVRVEKRGT